MNKSQSNNNRIGRIVLLSVLLTLLAVVILLTGVAVFGSKDPVQSQRPDSGLHFTADPAGDGSDHGLSFEERLTVPAAA